MPDKDNWKLNGDFVLSCNCTVFCPCVISLGQHEPTEGRCQAWAGLRIDKGFHEDTDLAGVKAGCCSTSRGRLRAATGPLRSMSMTRPRSMP